MTLIILKSLQKIEVEMEKKQKGSKIILPNLFSKKEKEEYVIKKDTKRKTLRFVFWALLIFFFVRGISVSLRPDQTKEVEQKITTFKHEFSNYKDQDSEILGFAQNFTKEYLTYETNNQQDYIDRLKVYVSDNFLRASDIVDLKGNAKVIYAEAYRKEKYSESQVDVYVLAEVEYLIPQMSDDGSTYDDEIKYQEVQLKVPVYVDKNSYIVEDIPLYVNDVTKSADYKENSFTGNELTSDVIKDGVEKSLQSFFKAYYEADQNVINYYLTKDADITKFQGLHGRMKFDDIEELRCFQKEGDNYIVCITKIKIIDAVNGVKVLQQFNLTLKKDGDKYYVKDMETKTININ